MATYIPNQLQSHLPGKYLNMILEITFTCTDISSWGSACKSAIEVSELGFASSGIRLRGIWIAGETRFRVQSSKNEVGEIKGDAAPDSGPGGHTL